MSGAFWPRLPSFSSQDCLTGVTKDALLLSRSWRRDAFVSHLHQYGTQSESFSLCVRLIRTPGGSPSPRCRLLRAPNELLGADATNKTEHCQLSLADHLLKLPNPLHRRIRNQQHGLHLLPYRYDRCLPPDLTSQLDVLPPLSYTFLTLIHKRTLSFLHVALELNSECYLNVLVNTAPRTTRPSLHLISLLQSLHRLLHLL